MSYFEFLEVGAGQYQQNTIHNTKIYYCHCEDILSHISIIGFDYHLLQEFFDSREDKGLETNNRIKKAIMRC